MRFFLSMSEPLPRARPSSMTLRISTTDLSAYWYTSCPEAPLPDDPSVDKSGKASPVSRPDAVAEPAGLSAAEALFADLDFSSSSRRAGALLGAWAGGRFCCGCWLFGGRFGCASRPG